MQREKELEWERRNDQAGEELQLREVKLRREKPQMSWIITQAGLDHVCKEAQVCHDP